MPLHTGGKTGCLHTGVAANAPQGSAQLVYLDAYLPLEGENEIALWPSGQKERYRADLASGIVHAWDRYPKMSQWVLERLTI